uniref:Putative gtpase n=1 Tax=Triatoma infestans TaxID=30076 RepID=A0A023F778_TRIIF
MSQLKLLLPFSFNGPKLFNKILRNVSTKVSSVLEKDISEPTNNLILYNSTLNRFSFLQMKAFEKRAKQRAKWEKSKVKPLSVALKYIQSEDKPDTKSSHDLVEDTNESVNFPYSIKVCDEKNLINSDEKQIDQKAVGYESAVKEVCDFNDRNDLTLNFSNYRKNWMNDYEQYTKECEESGLEEWRYGYGTTNPKVPISKVPCGGCGAFLHCQDPAIPGYLPSEIFLQCKNKDLLSITCQRCHFMKYYDTILSISVDKNLYPKLLSRIKDEHALVLLMVDLTDFPCSIWSGILDIIGKKRPLFIVGNKVDLLWGDCKSWLNNVTQVLRSAFPSDANIQHISLISAKTGFGIEELINKLHVIWRYKGDVYLIGCTNVGKSTLFNALLQSDYCKVKAADLMQRATTSPWPGTTLNLLKFPILRPEGWRLYLRTLRLINEQKKANYEKMMRKQLMKSTKMNKFAQPQLIGHIGRTFTKKPVTEEIQSADNFTVPNRQQLADARIIGSGVDPNDPDFLKSKWFYDTPGVLHSDQILDLLTTEELMLTIPKKIIEPRTFLIRPGWSIFIAGLARLDYNEGDTSVRLTVFSSSDLPITVCAEENADRVYIDLLGTKYMLVPSGSDKRLKEWPHLKKSAHISLLGINGLSSCADIVLSSAGWISVTAEAKQICRFIPWTPLGRGVHVRTPSLLPYAVNLRGKKVPKLPAYGRSTAFRG